MDKKEFIKNKIKNYYKEKFKQEIINSTYISRRKEDIIYRIIDNLSHRAYFCFSKSNIERKNTHMELIGCDPDVLKEHIKKQLKDNMTFENYGEWEIDHIKPVSLFNLENEKEMFECFNYKNLQPLWKIDNIKKSNK